MTKLQLNRYPAKISIVLLLQFYTTDVHFLELNAELSAKWPVITEMKDPPEDSDQWRDVKDKLQYLEK